MTLEQNNNERPAQEISDSWTAWDAVPRDGPAIFVIDTEAMNEGGPLRGRWISLGATRESGRLALAALFGREPRPGEWAVVDQVGLGERMVPERLALEEVDRLPELLGSREWLTGEPEVSPGPGLGHE